MKIALITYHNALNYGAALQTHASQTFLESLGHDCNLVDYTNQERAKTYDMIAQINEQIRKRNVGMMIRMILGIPFMELRRNAFNGFYKKYTKLTKEKFVDYNDLSVLNKQFDLFIVGSDQVWNPNHNGKDMAYLLSFVDNKEKTMSYASSFGAADIAIDVLEDYRLNLNLIKYISTREQLGVDLIDNLIGKKPKLVVDPVFLMNKDYWMTLANKCKPRKGKAIFIYTNRKDQFANLMKTTNIDLSEYTLQMINRFINPGDFLKKNKKVDYFINPLRFLRNILDAELIFTASFHCLAFSLIFQKKFIVFLTGDEGKDERLVNLLKLVGLSHRIYSPTLTVNDIFNDIDYNHVGKILDELIAHSKDFIIDALNDVESANHENKR